MLSYLLRHGLVRGARGGVGGDAAGPHLCWLLARLPQVLRRHPRRHDQGHRGRQQHQQVPRAPAETGKESYNSLPDANFDGKGIKKIAGKERKTRLDSE